MPHTIASKIEAFFAQYRLRTYPKGQVLLLGGETTGYVYYLIKGQVKVYDVTYRGEEIILNIFKPPAFFPMAMAIDMTLSNPYVYEAETTVDLRQAPAEDVVAFVKSDPDVMYELLRRMYLGVEGLIGRISVLMGGSARSRLIYELMFEAQRFGNHHTDDTYTLSVTEKTLASRAGLSRETVSREIRKLRHAGLIETSPRSILIKDLQQLEELGQEG